jgi:gas vesicle protein
MSDRNSFGDFVSGLILGGIIGAAIAALTTPYTGDEAQEEVAHVYKNGLGQMQEVKAKTEQTLNQFKGLTEDKIKIVVQNLKEKADSIANRFEDMTSKGAGVLIEDEIV